MFVGSFHLFEIDLSYCFVSLRDLSEPKDSGKQMVCIAILGNHLFTLLCCLLHPSADEWALLAQLSEYSKCSFFHNNIDAGIAGAMS